MKIIVEYEPGDQIPESGYDRPPGWWDWASRVLNMVEPGASKHCVEMSAPEDNIRRVRHQRLGLTVEIRGLPDLDGAMKALDS